MIIFFGRFEEFSPAVSAWWRDVCGEFDVCPVCVFVQRDETMQCLSVQALTLRQLGKLTSLQVPSAWHGARLSLRCPRALHARQLWGSSSPLVQRSAALLRSRDAARTPPCQQTRFKGYKRKKGRAGSSREEEDDEEEDPEASDYEDELQEDPSLPKDYKDHEKAVQSLRFDLVMKTGLDIARQ